MAVGPGQVRFWRAGESNSSISVTTKRPKKRKRNKSASAAPLAEPKQPAIPAVGKPKPKPAPTKRKPEPEHESGEPFRAQVRLVLDPRRQTRLQSLFQAPSALAALLRAHPGACFASLAEAKLFLLQHRKELDGFIDPGRRDRDVELLAELLLHWSDNPPDAVGIDFDRGWLTPDQTIHLPLPFLHRLEVTDPERLKRQRDGHFPKQPFTLFQEGNHFWVAFTLSPIIPRRPQIPAAIPLAPSAGAPQPTGAAQTRPKRAPAPQKKKENNAVLTQVGTDRVWRVEPQEHPHKPLVLRPSVPPREPVRRVRFSRYGSVLSRGLGSMGWSKLSGWGVSGGLPSLGKRSR